MLARAALSGLISIVALSVAPAHSQPSGARSRGLLSPAPLTGSGPARRFIPPDRSVAAPSSTATLPQEVEQDPPPPLQEQTTAPSASTPATPGPLWTRREIAPAATRTTPSSGPAIAAQPPRPSPGARQQRKHPLRNDKVTAGNIGFMLGPRLNASGRLESALASFRLLTTTDFMRAGQLALQLDGQNRQRQGITKSIQEQAEQIAMAEDSEAFLLFAAHESFNPGVVGLAASRLTELYYRPAIVAARGAEETRGSCRSIPEFHITDALDLCKDLLVRHGGHAAAAGFTVRNENLPEFVARLKEIAKTQLSGKDLRHSLSADMEVP